MAADWHCCGSVNHFSASFSMKAWMRWKANEGGEKMSGGMPRGEGGQNLGCIVVCFPTVNSRRKWNGAAKYTNRTMKWRAWSSCGTRVSPCSGRWNACEYLLFKLEGQRDTSNHVFREKQTWTKYLLGAEWNYVMNLLALSCFYFMLRPIMLDFMGQI